MSLKKLLYAIKPPCSKCPYTLGQVQFVRSPCPECKANNHNMYNILKNGKAALFGEPTDTDGTVK